MTFKIGDRVRWFEPYTGYGIVTDVRQADGRVSVNWYDYKHATWIGVLNHRADLLRLDALSLCEDLPDDGANFPQ